MIALITPVGTSLFTNYLDQNGNHTFSRNYDRVKESPASNWKDKQIQRVINNLRQSSEQFIRDSGIQASAELQSIANIQRKLNNDITVYLLASDTIASRLAAEILQEKSAVLGDRITINFEAAEDVIKGLQVEDPQAFSGEGMTKLIQRINSISGGFVGSQTLAITGNFAINITGGYKATLPYLTILAQLEHVPLYYNFEDTDALIKIPQAPLVIDWASIERYSNVLSQIDEGIGEWKRFQKENHQAVQDLEAFIEVAEEIAFLSPIGQIFWDHYQRYFVADLPSGSYFSYPLADRQLIDQAVEELYGRLDSALRRNGFDSERCYKYLRREELGNNHDLNHGANVPNQNIFGNQDIFIFKSTANDHVRLLYTFKVKAYPIEVNGQETCSGEITRITIFELYCRDFNHKTYIRDWMNKFQGGNPPTIDFDTHVINFQKPTRNNSDNAITIDFVTRVFAIPQPVPFTTILQDRNQKIRRNQNVQTS